LQIVPHELRDLIDRDQGYDLRNPKHAAQRQKERYQRVMDAIHEAGAYALLLTATPYSRGIKDVNAQLKLLPRSVFAAKHQLMAQERFWTIQEAQQLPELPPCPTLTTPVVVRYYSETDDQGHRYVVFAKGGKRYFPHRINLRSVVFENELDPVLISLLKGHLLDVRQEDNHDVQMSFGSEWGEPRKGRGAGLRKAEVMKQFCSSPAQIEDLFRKLRKEDGFAKTRFVHQAELKTFVDHNMPDVVRNRDTDGKFQQLLDIIAETPGKLVVFCHYRQTARALSEDLKQMGVKADTTEGQAGERVNALLRRFAPVANEVLDSEMQEDDVKVLVVTSALAEGYNLQDASVLVNYDLPWRVLMLAQRAVNAAQRTTSRTGRHSHDANQWYYASYLGATLRKLMLDLDTLGEANGGALPLPVGVILDEFPTLGKLDSLVADVNLVRKRRISILIGAQTRGQFELLYGREGT
jgi:hypothetical protein